MAIKIAGTTVVDDSRGLTNIATVDATTAAAISAAGVGGFGTQDFVASGAIETGEVVILNADGTVSVVSSTSTSAGTSAVFETASLSYISATFDSNSNKVVISYKDEGNSNYGTAAVGTVSGTSISFGTPVVFESAAVDYTSIIFDSNSNKVVIAYRDKGNSNYGTAIVGTVSGTSISFGTAAVFETSASILISATFDSSNNKVVVGYTDIGNSYSGTAVVGTVSGTSISFGTPVVFTSYAGNDFCSTTFDSSNNKVVISYRGSGTGLAIVGTVSGTSISFGTPVEHASVSLSGNFITFDSNSNKVVIAYAFNSGLRNGLAVVGTVSGTSISFGTPVAFEADQTTAISIVFDSNVNKVVISYRDSGNSSAGTFVVGVVSGTSIKFDSPVTFNTGNSYNIVSTFDSNSNKVVVTYTDGGNSGYYTTNILTAGSTDASSYIGVATEAISDTATGAVTIDGGVTPSKTINNYDLANASYDSVSFSVAGQETSPTGLFFKPDGTKMYALGLSGDDVNEYNLSPAWDITTASYAQNFSVSTQTGYPQAMFFKSDGTKMYIAAQLPGKVFEYNLSTAWDISTASYLQAYDVTAQVGVSKGLSFKPDGTKMYVLDASYFYVNEYSLSTAWDISSSSYTQNFYVGNQEYDASGIFFKPDGNKMYVVGYQGDDINEYSLSTAWNITTASYVRVFSVSSQDTYPMDLFFKPDGTKVYVIGTGTNSVYQYSTGTFGGYTVNASQFVADNGTFNTTNNGRKIGKAISSTEIIVDSAMTGDETNTYLGSLV